MTASEPTTCEACQESDEGNPIHHHALIRVLETERDEARWSFDALSEWIQERYAIEVTRMRSGDYLVTDHVSRLTRVLERKNRAERALGGGA